MWHINRSGSFHKVETPYLCNKGATQGKCYKGRRKSADRGKMKWTKRDRERERKEGNWIAKTYGKS